MAPCQRCSSSRLAGILAPCSDMCSLDLAGRHGQGYVPRDLGIGGGDDVHFVSMPRLRPDSGEVPSAIHPDGGSLKGAGFGGKRRNHARGKAFSRYVAVTARVSGQ